MRELPAPQRGRSSGRIGVELERARLRAQRVLLVAEHRSSEQVEEPVLARLGRIGVVQPGRRLEDDAALAAAAHERGELLDGRDALAAAADLRAYPRAAISSSATPST